MRKIAQLPSLDHAVNGVMERLARIEDPNDPLQEFLFFVPTGETTVCQIAASSNHFMIATLLALLTNLSDDEELLEVLEDYIKTLRADSFVAKPSRTVH